VKLEDTLSPGAPAQTPSAVETNERAAGTLRRPSFAQLFSSELRTTTVVTTILFACSYVQPSRSITDVKVASVKKKLKDAGFARSVSRDDIRGGAVELGVDLDRHIANVIEALAARAGDLGLAGKPAP